MDRETDGRANRQIDRTYVFSWQELDVRLEMSKELFTPGVRIAPLIDWHRKCLILDVRLKLFLFVQVL